MVATMRIRQQQKERSHAASFDKCLIHSLIRNDPTEENVIAHSTAKGLFPKSKNSSPSPYNIHCLEMTLGMIPY